MRYWLGPLVWSALPGLTGWGMPSGATAMLDLRSTAQCAIAGPVPQGLALFVTPDAINLGASYTLLGTANDPRDLTLTPANRTAYKALFLLPNSVAGPDLASVLWEHMTVNSDPTGDTRCCPLQPGVGIGYELYLAGTQIGQKAFTLGLAENVPLLTMLGESYRTIRQSCIDGNVPGRAPDFYRKYLGGLVQTHGVDYHNFIPGDLPDEPPLPPSTKITDDFTRADGDTIGNQLAWTEGTGDLDTVSNRVRASGATTNLAEATTDLSTSDHYAQFDMFSYDSTNCDCAPACRVVSTGPTAYIGIIRLRGNNDERLFKIVTGTYTQLGSTVSYTNVSGDTYRTIANGSSITMNRNGSAVIGPQTDTAISSGTRVGIWGYAVNSGDMDNFEGQDITNYISPVILHSQAVRRAAYY